MQNDNQRLDAIKVKLMEFSQDRLGSYILIAARKLKKVLNHNLREYGIGHEQLQVLYILMISEQLKLAELAAILEKDKSTISRCINSLKSKNYISSYYDKNDNRNCVLSISSQGLELISMIEEKIKKNYLDTNANITKEEIGITKDVLCRLIRLWS